MKYKTKTFHLFTIITFVILLFVGCATPSIRKEQPNIILITTMNHPIVACNAYSGLFSHLEITPRMAAFGKEAMVFQNCYTPSAIPRPAGAVIYSGQHPHMTGTYDLYSDFPSDKEHLIIELNKLGYQTSVLGHWHFDTEPKHFDNYKVTPIHHSFYNPPYREKDLRGWPDSARIYNRYVDIQTTDFAIDYIQNSSEDSPFFLQVNYKASQELDSVLQNYMKEFEGISIPLPSSMFKREHWGSEAVKGKNDSLINIIGSSYTRRHNRRQLVEDMKISGDVPEKQAVSIAYNKYLAKYFAAYKSIDAQFGRIVDYLKKSEKSDNTIVIYMTHNGMMLGAHDLLDKRWMYEESMHIPLLIYNPYSNSKSLVEENLISQVDIAPTLIELAGGEVPEYMQGISFKDAFTPSGISKPRKLLYYQYWMHLVHHDVPAHYGIRTIDKKLIYFYGEHFDKSLYGTKSMFWLDTSNLVQSTPKAWEFYDLKNDPNELNNIYSFSESEDALETLKFQLDSIRKALEVNDYW